MSISRRDFIKQTGAAGIAMATSHTFAHPKNENKRPNILFIIDDQHNPRHMHWAGEKNIHTPSIDKLASESVCFDNAYCNSPICGPSRHCLYTGRYASEHHVMVNDALMNPECKTMMACLNEAGYTTANVGKMHNAPFHNRQDFQYVVNHEFFAGKDGISFYPQWMKQQVKASGFKPAEGHWSITDKKVWLEDVNCVGFVNKWQSKELTAERFTTDQCLTFMKDQKENRPDKPFFLHASYFPPHHPYGPIEEFAKMYKPEDMDLPQNYDARKLARWERPSGIDEKTFKQLKAYYFAFITQFDYEMGRLLDGLEELGLADNTIVIFTSDHGEMMGEHGRLYKDVMYEGSARIPMIIRWPGQREHRRESRLMSMIDVMPTLLAAAGADAPEDLPGKNILPIIRNNAAAWEDRAVFAEYNSQFPFQSQMWRRGDYKLIRIKAKEFRYQLFNVSKDPYELNDLARDPDYSELLQHMQGELDEHWNTLKTKLPKDRPKPHPRVEYDITWPMDPWKAVKPIN